MRAKAPEILPIFRSQLQGRLLALLCLEPERERTITDLARRLGSHVATVHREVDRLEGAGLVETRPVGRTRVVRAQPRSRFEPELSALVLKAFGPEPLLTSLLADVPGVDDAYIFGSWAERIRGTKGPPPRDIDVLVVGEPNRDEVYRAATGAEQTLGVAVDVVIRSREAFDRGADGLVRAVLSGPHVKLALRNP